MIPLSSSITQIVALEDGAIHRNGQLQRQAASLPLPELIFRASKELGVGKESLRRSVSGH